MTSSLLRRSRRLAALAAVVGLVSVAGACSTQNPPAATVNGTEIDGADFSEMLRLYAGNAAYVAAESAAGRATTGSLEGSASTDLARRLLSDEIFFVLVAQELERRGVEVTPGNEELARTMFAPRFLGGEEGFNAFPEGFRNEYIDKVARYISLQSDFAGIGDLKAATEKALAEDADTYAKRCTNHILVETEEEALEIKADLDDGGDFAAIAGEKSIDTGSGAQGGFLACLSPAEASGQYVPEFADAANAATIGEVTDPVQSEFGFHLILVDRTEPAEETAVMQALLAPAGDSYTTWLNETFGSAEIEVNPRYGTWNSAVNGVEPPEGAAQEGSGATEPAAEAPAQG